MAPKPLPLLTVLADFLGGWERIRCPHCPLMMRFKGVSTDAERKRLRALMADHISNHTN